MRSTGQRWTWLGPIRAVLVILAIFELLSLPIRALQLFNGAYPIGLVRFPDLFSHGTTTIEHPGIILGGVEIMWHPTGAYQIVLFGLSHGLGVSVAILPMLFYAYHVTDVALRDDPFTLVMVGKLRRLGLLILVGGLIGETASFLASRSLLAQALTDQPALRDGALLDQYQYPSLWWLVPGLMVLAFAEVVRRGCYLRAELDEVI